MRPTSENNEGQFNVEDPLLLLHSESCYGSALVVRIRSATCLSLVSRIGRQGGDQGHDPGRWAEVGGVDVSPAPPASRCRSALLIPPITMAEGCWRQGNRTLAGRSRPNCCADWDPGAPGIAVPW